VNRAGRGDVGGQARPGSGCSYRLEAGVPPLGQDGSDGVVGYKPIEGFLGFPEREERDAAGLGARNDRVP
jgi:hypothetical protein